VTEAGKQLPAIVITGQGRHRHGREGHEGGRDRFHRKPTDPDVLLACVTGHRGQAASLAERSAAGRSPRATSVAAPA
jgi:DNA-binding response OmpR family regulator